MKNLLTKTLFISLLLPIITLPKVQEKKIKNSRWKEIGKSIVIVGTGALVGKGIGIIVGGVLGEQTTFELKGNAMVNRMRAAAKEAIKQSFTDKNIPTKLRKPLQVLALEKFREIDKSMAHKMHNVVRSRIAGQDMLHNDLDNYRIRISGEKIGIKIGSKIGLYTGTTLGVLIVLGRILLNFYY